VHDVSPKIITRCECDLINVNSGNTCRAQIHQLPHGFAGKVRACLAFNLSPTRVTFAVLELWLCRPYTWFKVASFIIYTYKRATPSPIFPLKTPIFDPEVLKTHAKMKNAIVALNVHESPKFPRLKGNRGQGTRWWRQTFDRKSWTCELGYGADTMFHRTYFLSNKTLIHYVCG